MTKRSIKNLKLTGGLTLAILSVGLPITTKIASEYKETETIQENTEIEQLSAPIFVGSMTATSALYVKRSQKRRR